MNLSADYRFIKSKNCHKGTKAQRNTKVFAAEKGEKEDTQRLCFVGNCCHDDTNMLMIDILGMSYCGR